KSLGLRKYELEGYEWKLAEQLRDVLEIFNEATLFFSHSTPNLAQVIPAMDEIDETLATLATSPELDKSIRVAVALSKQHLNKYYEKTDMSEVYRIAMILHPGHKLSYFKEANWEADWINNA
ncbi:hypothetical protein BXZ70DRAFT_865985, partial [Cristinia sonorae]